MAALRRFTADGMADRAPAMAYYGVLSLFPLLLIAFAVLRLLGDSGSADDVARYARDGGASSAVAGTLRAAAETARHSSSETAGSAGVAGLVALLYGGSRAFTASGRAMDAIAGRATTQRSPVRRLQDVAFTLVALGAAIALFLVVLVSGRVLEAVLGVLGLQDGLDAWRIVRWPTGALLGLLVVSIVRWAAPSDRPPFRLLTPGVIVSVAALIVGTVGFDLYVSYLATYNATYGAFAGGVILMLWVWLGAVAFLFGAELDAAIADERRPTGVTVGRTPP